MDLSWVGKVTFLLSYQTWDAIASALAFVAVNFTELNESMGST